MERKQQLHDEDTMDPIELARKLKVCEAEKAGLRRNYKELASEHEDQIHANMGLQHQLKALKKEMAKSRRGEPKSDKDYEFLCRENEDLHRNLKEQVMKLWACERENMDLQKEREQATNPQREKEEFLCRENEDLRKEIEELTERLHNTDELAGKLETFQLKTIEQHQVILDNRGLLRKMGRCRKQLSTQLMAEKEEKQFLSQQNEDLRKELKCQENLQSGYERAMKNRISEMKHEHWQEVENLENEIATQKEEKDAIHLEKEALKQKMEEMVKKDHEQTMRLKAVEELLIRLKQQNEEKEKAEEALTSKNLAGEKDGKEVGEELHKKSRKPSMMRRFIKLFTPKRKEKKKNKKDKMESA